MGRRCPRRRGAIQPATTRRTGGQTAGTRRAIVLAGADIRSKCRCLTLTLSLTLTVLFLVEIPKLRKLSGCNVGNRPKRHGSVRPMDGIVAISRKLIVRNGSRFSRPRKYVDDMLAPPVNQRCHGPID